MESAKEKKKKGEVRGREGERKVGGSANNCPGKKSYSRDNSFGCEKSLCHSHYSPGKSGFEKFSLHIHTHPTTHMLKHRISVI